MTVNISVRLTLALSLSGEIGKHNELKLCWLYSLEGSSPFLDNSIIYYNYLLLIKTTKNIVNYFLYTNLF